MKKKFLSLLLAASLVFGMTACGNSSDGGESVGTDENESAGSSETGGTEAANDGEVYNVIMQIVTFGQEFSGIADVENAINDITIPEIGVSVTLDPVAAWDLPNTSSLAITSNEKLDLMCILPMGSNMDSVSNYSRQNMLIPLNDLYDTYGQDIKNSIGDLVDVGYVGEDLYAVPAKTKAGSGQGFLARTSVLEELGFEFIEGEIYTLDDLDPLFAAYKEKYGDGYYPVAGFSDGAPRSSIVPTDDLGDPAVGSLMNGGIDNTTVVNLYTTDEYKSYVERMRRYYLEGYINPDVITITDTWGALLGTGQYLGTYTGINGDDGMDSIVVNEASIGEDLTCIKITPDYATTTSACVGLWAIPVTCENPEKTMQFLNLLYQDRELEDSVGALLAEGIEGQTYQIVEKLDGARAIIDYVDGVTNATVPFEQQMPIYGDSFIVPVRTPLDASIYEKQAIYNDSINYSKAFGYTFDSSNYSAQLAAINNVISQYAPILGWGTVEPDEVLPQFISELETAGINDVIAANQEQLDAWLAQQ